MGLVYSARSTVEAVLSSVADTTVIPYPRAVDSPTGRTAVLAVEAGEPAGTACPDTVVTVVAYLFTGLTADLAAWDQVDTLLDDVLAAVDAQRACRWTGFESVIYRDAFPAYRLTLEV